MSQKDELLIDLLHEIMRHCYYHDGDERKIALMTKWREFYDAWTTNDPPEARQ